nr:PfkB family carbohydrate kinase [Flexivirga oryzae]
MQLRPAQHAIPRDAKAPEVSRVTVLSVGYLVLDVITTTHVVGRNAGGTAGNVAADLAWLGQRSGLLARIGNDVAGELLRNDLSGAGVDTSHVHCSADVETPMLIQRLTESGPEYLFRCPVCNYKFASHRPATREQAEEAAGSCPEVVFVDRASKASIDLMGKVKQRGGIVMFEPNGPGRRGLTAEAIALADILKVSEERVPALGSLLSSTPGSQVQVRTRGARGLEFRLGHGAWHSRRAHRARVSDSAGAGDWVTAGLLAYLTDYPRLTHRNISDGLDLGQALAALSCAFVGARGMNNTLSWGEAQGLLDRPGFISWQGAERKSAYRSEVVTPAHQIDGCTACGNRA